MKRSTVPERTEWTGAEQVTNKRSLVAGFDLLGLGGEEFTCTILHLKGISTDDFSTALEANLGRGG